MKKTLEEIEKVIIRQIETGFTGKINLLKKSNDEIIGHFFIEDQKVTQFHFLSKKGFTALHDFIYFLAKGLEPKFIIEPEVVSAGKENIYLPSYQDFLEEILSISHKIADLMSFIPPSRTLVKIGKNIFSDRGSLTMVEFMVAILVIKFREIGKIILESDYSEIETLDALISLRRKGCLKVIS